MFIDYTTANLEKVSAFVFPNAHICFAVLKSITESTNAFSVISKINALYLELHCGSFHFCKSATNLKVSAVQPSRTQSRRSFFGGVTIL